MRRFRPEAIVVHESFPNAGRGLAAAILRVIDGPAGAGVPDARHAERGRAARTFVAVRTR